MNFGLIGKSLSHSFSQGYFQAKFQREGLEHSYQNLEFDAEQNLYDAWGKLKTTFDGLNVTLPYKKTLLSMVDELDPHAAQIGAINCIAIVGGKTYGYNTDFQGFYQSVYKKSFTRSRRALILGNGGASLAVRYAVENLLKMPLDIAGRDGSDIDWKDLGKLDLGVYSLIVNATPIGMYPNSDAFPPLWYSSASQDTLFVDLIYNPTITQFLEKADEQGCMILNGLPMLYAQADISWELWKGH